MTMERFVEPIEIRRLKHVAKRLGQGRGLRAGFVDKIAADGLVGRRLVAIQPMNHADVR